MFREGGPYCDHLYNMRSPLNLESQIGRHDSLLFEGPRAKY
jgi:hypothetical protein